MFGPKMHVCEAPLAIGALAGGLLGSAGVAGLTLVSGAMLGAAAGGLLGGMFSNKGPKIQKAQDQSSNAAAQTPALPPATTMPATPATPAATPVVNPQPDGSQDIGATNRPIDPAEASTPTTQEVARGELEKKRKGRLSTILTSPQSRLQEGEDAGFERLGG